MIEWEHDRRKVKTIYTVEYVDDEKTMERFDKTGDFGLCKKRVFDGDVGDALLFYFARMYDEKTCWCHLYEEISIDGETVREACIEPDSTFKWSMRHWIANTAADELDQARKQISELQDTVNAEDVYIKQLEKMVPEYKTIRKEACGW